MKIGNKDFDVKNHTYVMGILNVTPDSFSDGGEHTSIDAALFHARRMINEGVDIIDVGGESTRPGFSEVSSDEEIARTVPIIEKIKSEFNIPISIDTYKPETAREAVKAGAVIINDVYGHRIHEGMDKVIKESGAICCLMHNRDNLEYVNFLDDFFTEMSQILDSAVKEGIDPEKIILDPGIGFCKDTNQNLLVLDNMDMLNHFDVPWLLGASRKSVIGNTLNLPVGERLEGTLALTALSVMKGAAFVRVHDVLQNKRVIEMLEAVKNV